MNGSSRNLGGRAAWRRVCGRAKLLAGTLRCLRLCWRLPWDWSPAEQLGRCPKPHKGRCPLTLQGADEKGRSPPLTPPRDWVGRAFMLLPRAAFDATPKPLFASPTFREEPKIFLRRAKPLAKPPILCYTVLCLPEWRNGRRDGLKIRF